MPKRQDFMACCPICKRVVAAYVPSRGDGTDVRLPRHIISKGVACSGSGYMLEELRKTRRLLGFAEKGQ